MIGFIVSKLFLETCRGRVEYKPFAGHSQSNSTQIASSIPSQNAVVGTPTVKKRKLHLSEPSSTGLKELGSQSGELNTLSPASSVSAVAEPLSPPDKERKPKGSHQLGITINAKGKISISSKVKIALDFDRHCGVVASNGVPCTRSLTCKSHSISSKRAVPGRTKSYDELLASHLGREYKPKEDRLASSQDAKRKSKHTGQSVQTDSGRPIVDDSDLDDPSMILEAFQVSKPAPLAMPMYSFARRRDAYSKIRNILIDALNYHNRAMFRKSVQTSSVVSSALYGQSGLIGAKAGLAGGPSAKSAGAIPARTNAPGTSGPKSQPVVSSNSSVTKKSSVVKKAKVRLF